MGGRTKNGVASIFEETDIEFLFKEPSFVETAVQVEAGIGS